ncbi:MAG TPA: peptidase M20, partial [Nitrospinota bacterium]|nr:peptidase M20 [Nitrospinota bacterium]
MGNTSAVDKVVSLIHPEEVVDLAVALGNIPSPSGDEEAIGVFLSEWLRKEGFQPFTQCAARGRDNIVARIPG